MFPRLHLGIIHLCNNHHSCGEFSFTNNRRRYKGEWKEVISVVEVRKGLFLEFDVDFKAGGGFGDFSHTFAESYWEGLFIDDS